jgi:hypothetical protein
VPSLKQSAHKQSSPLYSTVSKLLDVIEEENSILRDMQVTSHGGFTDRKNQALRELLAAQRSESADALAGTLKPILESLSVALATNATLLKLHIGAVGEMSDIMIGSLRESESDGTYSRGRLLNGASNRC